MNPCEKSMPEEVEDSKPSHNVNIASLRSDRVVTFPGTSGNLPAEQLVTLAGIATRRTAHTVLKQFRSSGVMRCKRSNDSQD